MSSKEESHAEFHDDEIASLIDGAHDALKDSKKIDGKALSTRLISQAEDIIGQMQAIAQGDDMQTFVQSRSPSALANIYEALDRANTTLHRFIAFGTLAGHHYDKQAEVIQEAYEPTSAVGTQSIAITGQIDSALRQVLAPLTDADIKGMVKDEPRLKPYRSAIDLARRIPEPDLEAAAAIDEKDISAGVENLQKANAGESGKPYYADAISQLTRFKLQHMQSTGHATPMELFAFQNRAPQDLVDTIINATESSLPKLIENYRKLGTAAAKKINTQPDGDEHKASFTWEQAKELVVAAYENFDPHMGEIAQRAFDENWISARKHTGVNPFTMNVPTDEATAEGHPFAIVDYNGSRNDVLILGHEMGHVIASYIAGQHNRLAAANASLLIQETFSHFGEKLVEQEMLKRSKSALQKTKTRSVFTMSEAEKFNIVPMIQFEKALYQAMKRAGPNNLTFDELNSMFQTGMQQAYATKKEFDVRDGIMPWHFLNQPAFSPLVYPVVQLTAGALMEKWEQDPESFRRKYMRAMQAGNTISITQMWDMLLGKGVVNAEFFKERTEKAVKDVAERARELDRLPDYKPAVGAHSERASKRSGTEARR